jgi:UDP-N-acetylmuramyl pentapeptide phosphotransferase/UDP-N-acetylglucosamine-1-phosphate transferase
LNIFLLSGIIAAIGFLSYSLTYLIRNFALRKNLIDIPNERSLHDIPTPKGGGIAITLSWYIGISVLFFSGIIERDLYFALLSGILIAVVSLIDDVRGLKPIFRLIVHFMTAILAFYFLKGLRPLVMPELNINYNFIIYPLAIIGMVWFINLFNFMDGVDGFASVEVVTIAAVLFVMSWNIITLVLIMCVAGFLCWNWPKAKIFMGDVGSTQLGFILIVLGIYFHNTFEFSILNWIMLTSPFWFDATLTLFRRWRNKEKLSEAHRKHAYQRIVQAGISHEKVNIFLILINLFIITLIIIYREVKYLQIPIFGLSLVIFYLITRAIDRKVPFKKGSNNEHSKIH